jgi:hypothetical protein
MITDASFLQLISGIEAIVADLTAFQAEAEAKRF